ncbi:hypothetical protein H310_07204 [Aphanomyces invadans]|uniref:Uncharacterized protein n=1 Tax=Aphanomyces invadans TaxID=157072 RepID=A0A024U333_9STRA|nr:hypothetical protein H310_07204 [Aphanomyces invadans]ETW00635.1 hypothetical protein H310_07204 [Aphanomyces invadans]|eukprot:XP_008870770.1 hypothetical protein H310_07204 [Aphanomyces invadans]
MGGGVAYTRGTSFMFKHWVEEPFELTPADISTLDLPGSKKAGLILRYRDIELVVSSARALPGDGTTTTKARIEFTGRTTEAIRKATTYFTAATTTSVSFFVRSEVERAHLIHLVELNTVINPATASQSPPPEPHAIPLPSEIPLMAIDSQCPAAPALSSHTRQTSGVKHIIDDGFQSLETAAALEGKQDWAAALHAYEHAHRCFFQSCPHIPPDKASTRQLLQEKCTELSTTIATLRSRIEVAASNLPPAPVIPTHFTPTIAPATVPTAPPQQPISPVSSVHELHDMSPPSLHNFSIDERMHSLHKFAEAQDVKRAQEQKLPIASDLALRLAALKMETTVVPPLSTLEARLQRLRGSEPSPTVAPSYLAPIAPDDGLASLVANLDDEDNFSEDDTLDYAMNEALQNEDVAVHVTALLAEAQQVMTTATSSAVSPSTQASNDSGDAQVDALVKQVLDEVALETKVADGGEAAPPGTKHDDDFVEVGVSDQSSDRTPKTP